MSKLKSVRESSGVSQKRLSELSGINLRTLQAYEQGKKILDRAKLDTILKICLALDCKIENILEDSNLFNKYLKKEG